MSVSRRSFFQTLHRGARGAFSGALISARGREALMAEAKAAHLVEPAFVPLPDPDEIRLDSNENPLGPGKVAIDALVGEFHQAGRYPFNSRQSSTHLTDLLAKEFHTEPENIVLGAGSTEILRNAVRAFTSRQRGLATAAPSFEVPFTTAELVGSPVTAVPVDSDLRLDLNAMARAAKGAGLVFLCNPNNPTGTVHSFRAVAEFVSQVQKESPGTVILIDEAYHDYVTDRSYRTTAQLGLNKPGVLVSRTFSKAYGLAGLRIGYAIGQKETIQRLARYKLNYNVNVLGIAAAVASFHDAAHIAAEKARNAEARKLTVDFFESAGYKATKSETNFIFVNLGRPAKEFREACQKYKIAVGRDFAPFENTHVRVSIGTLEEMQKAVEVFRKVLTALTNNTNSANGN